MENLNDLLNRALDSISEEDFIEAKKLLETVINSGNENIEVYKNLGLCEVNLDNPINAIKAFDKAVELDNSDATSIFYLASCYSRTGQKELAIEKFEEVLKLRPDYCEVYKNLAMIYIEYSQIDNAIELVKKAIDNPAIENDSSLYYILATSYMLKKDYNNAILNLELAIELNPEHLPLLNSLAVCYMNIGEFEKSNAVLRKAFELNPEHSLTVYNLGILNQTIGDYAKALKFFQISYQIEPSITMLSTLANCSLKAGEYNLASTLYQNLVMTYPNNIEYRLALSEAFENLQDYASSLEQVNKVLSLDEKNIDLIKKKGALLRKLSLYQESIDAFMSLVKRGKIDIEVYYNLAFNYVELSDFDNAKEMFKKCITLEPNNPYAHKDLGVLYLKMNCYEWAVDEMKEAITLEDDVAEFHYSLGVANMMLSNIEDAILSFERALSLQEDDADSLAYLGYAHLIQDRPQKALEILQKALQIQPDNFLAKLHISKYYFKYAKYDTAKQFLQDIIEVVQDEESLNMLAVSYMQTEDYENAMGIFSKLVLKYPKNHILLTNLAKCESKCDKKEQALEHLRQALLVFDDYSDALELLKELNNGR